jgi:hypothetical protein
MDKRRAGTWLVVAILMVILAAAIGFAYKGLTVHSDLTMPVTGDIALGLGVFFSLLIGIGLMALVFYSSRAGYDNPPQIESDHSDANSSPTKPKSRVIRATNIKPE